MPRNICLTLSSSAAWFIFYRNVFSHVPATRVRDVEPHAIHAQESRDAADRKARMIVEDLRAAKMHTAADLVERVSETLTYYAFRDIHWQKIRHQQRLRYIAGTPWSARCYMNMRPLYQPQVPQTDAVA